MKNKMNRMLALTAVCALLLSGCSDTAAATTTAAASSTSYQAEEYVGTWNAFSYNMYSAAVDPTMIGASTVVMNKDGTGTFAFMSDTSDPMHWSSSDDGTVFHLDSYEDADYKCSMNGNVLVVELFDENTQIFLTKDAEEPAFADDPQLTGLDDILLDLLMSENDEEAPATDPSVWYGDYEGVLNAGTPLGTLTEEYGNQILKIYATLNNQDGVNYLKVYYNENHDPSTDKVLLTTAVDLYDYVFTVADGTSNSMFDVPFTSETSPILSAFRQEGDPVKIVLTGTYYDPKGASEKSDGFKWTIEMTKTTAEGTASPSASTAA